MQSAMHLPLVELTRGEQVESIHYGSFALADANGTLMTYGNVASCYFLRSSAKPFQALPLIENGGVEKYQLSLKEIAILCSSHSGTDEHAVILEKLHRKIGIQESDLQCGIHPPYDKKTQEQLLLKGEKPTPIRHNCSGKHTAMMALAKILGAPLDSYLSTGHPVQAMILKTFSEMCDVPVKEINLGIDGCSAPVFSIPLTNAALGLARLAHPVKMSRTRAEACRLIFKAMTEFPEMVAGPGRFDTVFMEAMQGAALSKSGAEGYLAISIPGEIRTKHNKGFGIAIKVSDGDPENRAAPVAALEILRHLGIIEESALLKLESFDRRDLKNWRGLKVGTIRPSREISNIFALNVK